MINVEKLAKSFGSVSAVKGVSFSVSGGEVFGFLGPNGAGKTTTINMLCTLLRPSSGTAMVNGFDVVRERDRVRKSIGLVFQQSTLDEYLTAEQNLRFHGYAYGIPGHEREERIRSLLTLVELWDRRASNVRNFSGGMKRRLEIARGLLHRPKVLFLDEPTLGLDPQTRRRLWEHILELRQTEDLTIFLTTHYMDEAENCERIGVIDHGEIVALDTPEKLKDSVGGDLITIELDQVDGAAGELKTRYGVEARVNHQSLSFEVPHGGQFLPEFMRTFPLPVKSVALRRPTLDDVFLKLTGRAIRDHEAGFAEQLQNMRRFRGH